MIILTGTVDVDPERRDEALQAGLPHMKATRAQAGCVDYLTKPFDKHDLFKAIAQHAQVDYC